MYTYIYRCVFVYTHTHTHTHSRNFVYLFSMSLLETPFALMGLLRSCCLSIQSIASQFGCVSMASPRRSRRSRRSATRFQARKPLHPRHCGPSARRQPGTDDLLLHWIHGAHGCLRFLFLLAECTKKTQGMACVCVCVCGWVA